MSPNAPGTQGYNPYAYVANNPVTWTDASGRKSQLASQSLLAIVFAVPTLIPTLYEVCAEAQSGFCAAEVDLDITFPVFDCAFDLECVYGAAEDSGIINEFGSDAAFSDAPETIPELEGAPGDFPTEPEVVEPADDLASPSDSGSDQPVDSSQPNEDKGAGSNVGNSEPLFPDEPGPGADGRWNCSGLIQWALNLGWTIGTSAGATIRYVSPDGIYSLIIRLTDKPQPRWGMHNDAENKWINPRTGNEDIGAGHRPLNPDC